MHRYSLILFVLLSPSLSPACGSDSPSRQPNDASRDSANGDATPSDTGTDGDGRQDEPVDAGGGGPSLVTAGPVTLTVDHEALTLDVTYNDEPRLGFDAEGIQLGLIRAFRDAENYDPYGFEVDDPATPPPPLERWAPLTAVELVSTNAAGLVLNLAFGEGATGVLEVVPDPAGRLAFVLTPVVSEGAVAYVRLRPSVDVDERFYGLGEYFDQVEHRGTVRAMQLEFSADLESANNEAHVPVPFVTGTSGWGLFVESDEAGVFELGADDPDRIDLTFANVVQPESFLFHVFAAAHPLDVTKHYYELTGYPAMPARWALGPWIWRDENRDQAQVESDVALIRDLDLATTAIWIDRPYASGVNSFDFEEAKFPDPGGMIEVAHDLGLRVALWHTPYLDEDDEATAELLAHARENDFFPAEHGLILNGWGTPLDLTNPDAFDWWQDQIRRYTDMGIEGFKLDYGEDITLGVLGARNVWQFFDGSTERTMHAHYQRLYHRAYAELLPESGGFLLCRGGTWGDQVHVSVVWPGDLDASFARMGQSVSDDGGSYRAVGGVPAALVASLSLGPSGFPLYGSDTGGYRHSPPDRETFVRWFQITALSPVMQVGTSSNDVPWEFNDDNGFDDEMLGWYRDYARLHLRLWPLVWTYLERLQEDGRPIQRALGLAYPELGEHPSDVFLLGDDILVAPVVDRGARERTVPLPTGTWLDWWTGEAYEGPGEVTVDAPLDTLPLFVRAGGVIPMLRPTIDAIAQTVEPERVDTFANDAGVLHYLVGRGAPGQFELFDGASLAVEQVDGAWLFATRDGAEFDSGAVITVIGVDEPAGVTLGGEPHDGWSWQSQRGGELVIDVPPGEQSVSVR